MQQAWYSNSYVARFLVIVVDCELSNDIFVGVASITGQFEENNDIFVAVASITGQFEENNDIFVAVASITCQFEENMQSCCTLIVY